MIELTPGDPAGVGPAVMLAAWRVLADGGELALAGDPRIWRRAAASAGMDEAAVAAACRDAERPELELPAPGAPTPAGARLAWGALDAAIDRCLAGTSAGLATGPIAKSVLLEIGFPYAGHTDYLAERAGGGRVLMVMSAPGFHVGLHTVHIPLKSVPAAVEAAGVAADAALLAGLVERLGEAGPIGVLGLNPHAGEGGALGDEEAAIAAGVRQARAAGIDAAGPVPGDTAFAELAAGRWGGLLAMYHDQGLAPFKLVHFWDGVNVSVGLPFVRTSPDHGTAFDLAAAGGARGDSAEAAVRLALRLAAEAEG